MSLLFTIGEIADIIIMSLAIGYMFKDAFSNRPRFRTPEDYIRAANTNSPYNNSLFNNLFTNNDFWYATALVAPAIILHELGHKFAAMSFGYGATFHAAYTWLAIGVLLKLIGAGMIFFVPAYVSMPAVLTPAQNAIVSFAGPGVNLTLWLLAEMVLRNKSINKRIIRSKNGKDKIIYLALFKKINMFLFIFNMLPIPMFDGYHVYSNLLKLIF